MTTTTPTTALADLDKNEIEQEWAKVDPATAFHLIERHAEDWADAGRMMEAWRKANSSALTPSPQIAEVAELPPLPVELKQSFAEMWEDQHEEFVMQYARDAIAASRRAAGAEVLLQARSPEGDPWQEVHANDFFKAHANGYEVSVCVNAPCRNSIRMVPATPAPASAGQAAPALPESLKGMAVSIDVSTCDEDGGNRIFAELTGETGSDGTTLLAIETSRNFAAQPAESAGQAAPALPEGDSFKPVYWFSILTKCARLLNLPFDEPIPSGVLRAVEKLAAQPAEGAAQAGQVAVARVTGSDTVIGRESRRLEWVKGAKPFEFEPGTVLYAITERAAAPAEQPSAQVKP